MQDKSNDISLKQWLTEHKNELEANVLEVLGNKAAQLPLFPCCSGLFIRDELKLDRNQMQPLDELLIDMKTISGSIISHKENGLWRWRLPNNPVVDDVMKFVDAEIHSALRGEQDSCSFARLSALGKVKDYIFNKYLLNI